MKKYDECIITIWYGEKDIIEGVLNSYWKGELSDSALMPEMPNIFTAISWAYDNARVLKLRVGYCDGCLQHLSQIATISG